MILDTNFLFALVEHDPDAFRKSSELHAEGEEMWIPLPAIFEMFYGVSYLEAEDDPRAAEEMRRMTNLTLMYHLADADSDSMKLGAELLANADSNAPGDDSGVSNEDAVIGAIATERDDIVLTNNAEDFDQLGVDYQQY